MKKHKIYVFIAGPEQVPLCFEHGHKQFTFTY